MEPKLGISYHDAQYFLLKVQCSKYIQFFKKQIPNLDFKHRKVLYTSTHPEIAHPNSVL